MEDVPFIRRHHLRHSCQTSETRGVKDAISVALERKTIVRSLVVKEAIYSFSR